MFICGKCKESVDLADNLPNSIIKCFGFCRMVFHTSCVALSSAAVKQCKNSKNIKFVCDDCCKEPGQSNIQQMNELTATLSGLTNTFQKCAEIMMHNYSNGHVNDCNLSATQTTASQPAFIINENLIKSNFTSCNSDVNKLNLNNISSAQVPMSSLSVNKSHSSFNSYHSSRPTRRNIIVGTGINNENMDTVEPRKWVFLSRFAPTVSEENITQYLRKNFMAEDINCQRVLPKKTTEHNRPYSSFKINIPASLYPKIMSAEAWPKGVLIKDFVGRNLMQQDFLVAL